MRFTAFLASALSLAAVASAHAGHDIKREQGIRNILLANKPRSLAHCAAALKERGVEARNIQRRSDKAAAMLASKGSSKKVRQVSSLDESHESTEAYTIDTDEATIFASNASCVLSPEVTEGPYYVAGEYIRSDVTEGHEGVALHLELQVLDVTTCEPVSGAYTEIWSTNATGVYSGVIASGNGNSADTTNIDATFARGVQATDDDGVVAFDTNVPGHYTGRTNHIHVMVHLNATARDNGTLMDTTASHVGQVFFDQSLLTEVEATSPYSTNTQDILTNADDSICLQEAASSDPFVEYVILGDTVADGLLGWLAFGIDTSLSKSVSAAATLYETGGVASSSSSGGGGGGGGPGGF